MVETRTAIVTGGAGGIGKSTVRRLLDGYPGGRPGTGDEVAAAVEFLLSEPAGFISGVALPVDGAYR